jgi:hypothetical protein
MALAYFQEWGEHSDRCGDGKYHQAEETCEEQDQQG